MVEVEVNVETSTEESRLSVGRSSLWNLLHLPLRISERRLLLMGLDLMALNGALLLVIVLRLGDSLSSQLVLERLHWFVLLSAIWLPVANAFDAYDLHVAGRISTAAPAVVKAEVITVVVYLLIPYVTPALLVSRLTLFAFFLFSLVLLCVGRELYIRGFTQPFFNRPTLIIGNGWADQTIARAILEHDDSTYKIFGTVLDGPTERGVKLNTGTPDTRHSSVPTFSVLGDRHDLKKLVVQYRIATLILAIADEADGELRQILMDCLELGVSIVPLPIFYEQLTGRVPVEHVGGDWRVAMPIHHPSGGALWPVAKPLMDIVLSISGLFLLTMVSPFIAAAIYLDSPGPIFYTQERVGRGGRRFRMYKFRSMATDAENGKAVWAQKNDSRVTRVGHILRLTHMDEFPQFLNILKGEMSVVGPRPERPEFVEQLAGEIPFYRVRHAVRPGAAGWGLVKLGYGASKEDALLKLQYDLYYIKHQSFWLDIVILLKTMISIINLRGR